MTARGDDSRSSALQAWVRALESTAPIVRNPEVTLPTRMAELGDLYGSALALADDAGRLTFRALAERCNRYSRWALERKLGAGDVVGLMMGNSAEYFALWLGITRTRATVALISPRLVGDSLAHAISIIAPRLMIVGAQSAAAVAAVRGRLPQVAYWAHGEGQHDWPRIDLEVEAMRADILTSAQCPLPRISDRALYIYTSGTTGVPKAASISHYRLMLWSHWFAGMLDTSRADKMYNCLPMYHGVGGVVAIGATLVNGGSVVLRPGFSSRDFWRDIRAHECTLFQYIGELCRILVQSSRGQPVGEHSLRACCGNGLAADIWQEFKERLRLPRILEFYAATEANFALYNCEGRPGALGRIPPFLAHRFRVALVRFDVEAGLPVRNSAGFCEHCAPFEAGEAISRISQDPLDAGARFEGYSDPAATDRKLLRDVFEAGDAWFASGDLMRRDRAGFYYFVDRIGDTFRWKGENVSTTEVTATIAAVPGVIEALVYGVTVPGQPGRAGMAAIVCSSEFDLGALQRCVNSELPDYARPVFLRILPRIEMTATFKPRKNELVRAGYDLAVPGDVLYVKTRADEAYVRLDAALLRRIQDGNERL